MGGARQQWPTPLGKDANKLELFGKKMVSTEGLRLRIANQQAILSCYNFNSWDAMSKFKEFVPSDSKTEFSALVDEVKAVVRSSLHALLDSVDSATCTVS